jgi:polyhydroxyalkanoate synthesis repressor PhaR
MQSKRVVKKYPNRRLYDTDISSYITLGDVRQLVLDREDFIVQDAKTGEDLTRSVMLQIIGEYEERGQPIFSTKLLGQIIRFYGDPMQSMMGTYLEKSLQVFLDQQQTFRSQLSNVVGQGPWAMMQELTAKQMEVWQEMQNGIFSGAGKRSGDKK